ncbi:MAG: sulfurtransferase TusA family protein [Tatlockia sp.]|nr:sulfurtransferase TusA family protein [Tatlockia sp.]
MADYELDARRLLCPMPVIKAQNFTKQLQDGDMLTIIATDPGTMLDLPCWCRINGHKLIEQKESDGEIIITLQIVKDKG